MTQTEIISFLDRLKKAGINVAPEGDNLSVVLDEGADETMLGYIKENKQALLDYFRTARTGVARAIRKSAGKACYRTSNAQKRLWMLEQIQRGGRAYYIPSHIKITGSLDAAVLKQALELLTQKHESLRTVFELQEDGPVQRIQEKADCTAIFTEAAAGCAYSDACLDMIAQWQSSLHFNLQTGPLFSLRLTSFEGSIYVLSFVIHHIVADAQSISILVKDLIDFYQQLKSGSTAAAAPLAIQFSDYAEWEQEQMASESFSQDREYWKQRFAEEPMPVELPYRNGERPANKTQNGSVAETRIDAASLEKIEAICRDANTTPFVFFYATVQSLLYKYTGLGDITIGTSVHGRDYGQLNDQIGLYARTIPLRMEISGADSFTALVNRSRQVVQDGLVHQLYPFDLLTEESGFARNPSRSPLFDIMIDYIVAPAAFRLDDFEVSPVRLPHTTSKFDLTFTFLRSSSDVVLNVEYNTDLFSAAFMEQLLAHYQYLLQQYIQQPGAAISSCSLLSAAEKAQQLTAICAGSFTNEPFVSVKELFEATAAAHPFKAAVECGQEELDYDVLNSAANQLARYLQDKLGDTREKVVGIMMDRSERLLTAVMAVVKSGAAFLPINADAPASYKEHLFSDSGLVYLLTDSEWLGDLSGVYSGPVFAMDVQLDGLNYSDENIAANPEPGSLAYIIYTSGSTGKPKGVEITHFNMSNYLRWASRYYYEGLDRVKVPWFTSFSFDLSITSIFTPLITGNTLVVFPQSAPADAFLQMLQSRSRFGIMKITPSHITILGMLEAEGLKVDRVIVGGEELTRTHIQILRNINPAIRIFNEYGPTETTVGCTVEDVTEQSTSIGFPVGNTSIYIVNAEGQLLPPGFWGEIVVGGHSVGRRYHNREALTAEKFIPDVFAGSGQMYRTGDIGRWMPDGKIDYKGRADGQVKINGFRIETGEIENRLQELDGVTGAVVLIKKLDNGSKALIAFFTGDASLDPGDMRDRLSGKLPDYMLPGQYIHVNDFPLTTNGKTDKPALLAMADGVLRRDALVRRPENEQEQELVSLFEELIGVEGLGMDDNLFSFGLDSLKAIRAQTVLEKKYPGKIEIHDIFSNASVAKLIQHLNRDTATHEQEPELIEF